MAKSTTKTKGTTNGMQAAVELDTESGGGVSGMDAAQEEMQRTKAQAGFIEGGGQDDVRCGNCRYFQGGTCEIVEGAIGPDDVCQFFAVVENRGNMTVEEMPIRAVQKTMYITRVSENRKSGKRTWFATASGVKEDAYGERMSVDLYHDFVDRMEKREPVAAPFGSDFWNGGMPYLSIAHHLDLNGAGVVGEADDMWVEGDVFKAKGTFADTELADAVFRAIQEDKAKNVPDEQQVRISIAFLDYGHSHEGFGTFSRKSMSDTCQFCSTGVKDKVYRSGILIHLAVTRIPAYTDTAIDVVERAMSTTDKSNSRFNDAASIVGPEKAAELEELSAELVGRSGKNVDANAVVIKSEDDMKKDDKEAEVEDVEEEDVVEDKKEDEEEDTAEYKFAPWGGATSLDEADAFFDKQPAKQRALVTAEDVVAGVIGNLVGANAGQREAIGKVIFDYAERFDNHAVATLDAVRDELAQMRSQNAPADGSSIHPVLGEVEAEVNKAFDEAAASELSLEEKFAIVQVPINRMAEVIRAAMEGEASGDDIEAIVSRRVAEATAGIKRQLEELTQLTRSQIQSGSVNAQQGGAVRRSVFGNNSFTAGAQRAAQPVVQRVEDNAEGAPKSTTPKLRNIINRTTHM
jgi:hypothetical protein